MSKLPIWIWDYKAKKYITIPAMKTFEDGKRGLEHPFSDQQQFFMRQFRYKFKYDNGRWIFHYNRKNWTWWLDEAFVEFMSGAIWPLLVLVWALLMVTIWRQE